LAALAWLLSWLLAMVAWLFVVVLHVVVGGALGWLELWLEVAKSDSWKGKGSFLGFSFKKSPCLCNFHSNFNPL
jgi:hypothetical protein